MSQRKNANLNAIKHGLFAQQDLLEAEDPLEYKRYIESVVADLKPANALQQTLAVRIAGIYWRLARIPKYESSLFKWQYKDDAIQALERLSLYETRLSRLAERLTQQLEAMKKESRQADSPSGSKNEKTKSVVVAKKKPTVAAQTGMKPSDAVRNTGGHAGPPLQVPPACPSPGLRPPANGLLSSPNGRWIDASPSEKGGEERPRRAVRGAAL